MPDANETKSKPKPTPKPTRPNRTKQPLTTYGVREFARLVGVSHTSIEKAISAGRLPLNKDGRLGMTARRAWDRQRTVRDTHSRSVSELARIKMQREKVRLEREELDLKRRRGELVNAAETEAAITARHLQFRDRLRRLSHTLPPKLAQQTQEQIATVLASEIDSALTELAQIEEFTNGK